MNTGDMNTGDWLARAAQLDAADPLAWCRGEFFIPDDEVVYLDGNSLGMPPAATLDRIGEVMRTEWGADLIASWDHWVDLPQRVGDTLAPLIGASPGEVVVHDSTTINLYQLITVAMRLRPDRPIIAISPDDFPTDRYLVDELAAQHGWQVQAGFDTTDGVGVVVRSAIDYRTAEVADMAREERRFASAGALTVWDLSHAAGLYPVQLNAIGARLAVGCTYKFLNGGPGAPGFSYVAGDLIDQIDQPIHGWFSQTDQFRMGAEYQPRADIGRLLIGTPSILSLVGAQVGIELSARAGIGAIYAKSQQLGSFALDLIDQAGLASTTPREAARRGGHVSVNHPDARAIVTAMAQHKIIADFREPDVIRLGCSPLTTRFIDVARAIAAVIV